MRRAAPTGWIDAGCPALSRRLSNYENRRLAIVLAAGTCGSPIWFVIQLVRDGLHKPRAAKVQGDAHLRGKVYAGFSCAVAFAVAIMVALIWPLRAPVKSPDAPTGSHRVSSAFSAVYEGCRKQPGNATSDAEADLAYEAAHNHAMVLWIQTEKAFYRLPGNQSKWSKVKETDIGDAQPPRYVLLREEHFLLRPRCRAPQCFSRRCRVRNWPSANLPGYLGGHPRPANEVTTDPEAAKPANGSEVTTDSGDLKPSSGSITSTQLCLLCCLSSRCSSHPRLAGGGPKPEVRGQTHTARLTGPGDGFCLDCAPCKPMKNMAERGGIRFVEPPIRSVSY